jgi:PncC family amidohydrolase
MDDPLVNHIHQYFVNRGWTLSVAESCTGGCLAARLTRVPGCSQYFLGSLVAYSNELKKNLLGVKARALDEQGAVSEAVVVQMAEGIQRLTDSDYSIAVTGIAGPGGGTPTKPVGTVWGAIASRESSPFVWSFQVKGEREKIMETSVTILLSHLWSLIKTQETSMGEERILD